MKRFLLTLLLLAPLALAAQNAKVTSGVLAFNDGDFAAAIADFKAALGRRAELNETNLIKALSYLGRSYMMAYQLSNNSDPAKKAKGKAVLDANPNFAQDALAAFREAAQLDPRARYTAEDKRFYPHVAEALYLQAFTKFQAGDNATALQLADASCSVIQENGFNNLYSAFMIKGYVLVKMQKKDEAIAALEKCIEVYNASRQSNPSAAHDANIKGVWENLILLYNDHVRDVNKTLGAIEKAKAMFPNDEQLTRIELQVYQDNPALYEQGLAKFRTALASNPNDVSLLINYANMLERKDTVAAIEHYKKALAIDANHFVANFNLGALYNNLAKRLYDASNATNNMQEADRLMAQSKQNLQEAYNYMKRAYEQKPTNRGVLCALAKITSFLGLDSEYTRFNQEAQAQGGCTGR